MSRRAAAAVRTADGAAAADGGAGGGDGGGPGGGSGSGDGSCGAGKSRWQRRWFYFAAAVAATAVDLAVAAAAVAAVAAAATAATATGEPRRQPFIGRRFVRLVVSAGARRAAECRADLRPVGVRRVRRVRRGAAAIDGARSGGGARSRLEAAPPPEAVAERVHGARKTDGPGDGQFPAGDT